MLKTPWSPLYERGTNLFLLFLSVFNSVILSPFVKGNKRGFPPFILRLKLYLLRPPVLYLEHGVYNMYSVLSRGSTAVKTSREAMQELVGEHEAITAYMQSLTRSAASLNAQPGKAKERIWNYRQRLYDFKDAIWFHLEIDERIFKMLLGNDYAEDPIEEHQEIQRLVNDMIMAAENAVIEKLSQGELNLYCASLGNAFGKLCRLLELHIAKENAILERVQQALDHG